MLDHVDSDCRPLKLAEHAMTRLQVEQAGKESGAYDLPAAKQELVFMGERCQDKRTLADYAICEPWIAQVHMPANVNQRCIIPIVPSLRCSVMGAGARLTAHVICVKQQLRTAAGDWVRYQS